MNFLRTMLVVLVGVLMISSAGYAVNSGIPTKRFINYHCDRNDISRHDNALNSKDWEELYDFVNAKRCIPLCEKGSNLTIAGDVRFDWRHTNEKGFLNGENQHLRGNDQEDHNEHRIGRNDFDVAFNLYFDYCCGRTWAVAQLEFNNTAGIDYNDHECGTEDSLNGDNEDGDDEGLSGSGFCCDICLKKAYVGYNLCCVCDSRLDVEIGRRNLYHVFDSEVQFLSRFDGILFRYTTNWDCWGDLYAYLGGFVIDERCNHFGWVTEVGMLDVCDMGIDVKYSFIDWRKYGKNTCGTRNPNGTHFRISQFTGYYHLPSDWLCGYCIPTKLYGAFLINHDAGGYTATDGDSGFDHVKGKDIAWYLGFRLGDVCHCGDWSLDVQYQYVQAQAVPDQDASGIGRGNWYDESLTKSARGNTNYKGWRIEALYAITDNLSIDAKFEASREINRTIGHSHRYNQLEIETIYAF